jgi:Protein of unknown function (DUF2934)
MRLSKKRSPTRASRPPEPRQSGPETTPQRVRSVPNEPERSSAPRVPPFADIPEELIAARAYEKWKQRGSPMGHDSALDWHAARAELEEERLNWAAPEPSDRERGTRE